MDNINSRKVTSISRRKFIVSSAAAGGGLALGINLPFSILPAAAQNAAADPEVTAPSGGLELGDCAAHHGAGLYGAGRSRNG